LSFKTITYSKEASFLAPEEANIGVITLNRPETLNAMNIQLLTELDGLLDEIAKDEKIRVIVITGSGRSFGTGSDLKEAQQLDEAGVRNVYQMGQRLCDKIENYPKPTIAALNGFTLGGGLELALACDIRIASEDARIGTPEVGLGLFPTWGGCVRLPRAIGKSKATELILTGGQITAKEAERIGLVSKAVPADELNSTVMWTSGTIATKAPVPLREAKKILSKAFEITMEEAEKIMTEGGMTCSKTEDIREGIKALFEKRAPQFKGK
jgi:enoyl-CoA hydratase/carnithine racemase